MTSVNPGPSVKTEGYSASLTNWSRVGASLPYSQFSANSTSASVPLFFMPIGSILQGIKIKHAQNFSGPGITGYTMSVGIAGNLALFSSAFNVAQSVGSNTFQLSQNFYGVDQVSPLQVLLTATSTGANLNQANCGSVDVWALISLANL